MQGGGGRFHYGHMVVCACFVILFIVFGVHYAFGLYLKPMIAEFKWGRAVVSGAYSLSWLIQGPSGFLMGRLNDRFGPRLVMTICAVLLFLGIFLTSQIHSSRQLYLSYGLLMGLGTGGVYVPLTSTIARWFAAGNRNTMTGIAISGMGLGTFLLSPASDRLILAFGWRTSYLVLGAALLLVSLAAAQFLRLPPRDERRRRIIPASGFTEAGGSAPLFLKEALKFPASWKVFGLFFCFGFCLMALLVHIAPHATDIGKPAATGAALVAAVGIFSIIGKIFFGILGDRLGNPKIYMICFIVMAASLLLLMSVRSDPLLYLFAAAFGLAYGGNASSQSPLVARLFGLKAHGTIFGALNIGFTLGATLGPLIAGFLFDCTGNYGLAFLVLEIMALSGFALAALLQWNMRHAGR